MEGLIMAAQLILSLSLLVFIHELGHFLAARAFGIKVEKFYIFMDAWGKKIVSFKWGDTEYGIGWLPIGGYVKIAGMIDESMDKDQMESEPQDWEFRSKPAWQRFIVMIGGIVFNIILGIILFTFHLYHFEKEYLPIDQMTTGIYAAENAREVGLQTGDKILKIDGDVPVRLNDVLTNPGLFFGTTLTVDRNGIEKDIQLPDTLFRVMKEPFIMPRHYDVFVHQTLEGSNAEKAGLNAEDQIISIDGKTVVNFFEMVETLDTKKSSTISLKIKREGKEQTLQADVSEDGKIGFAPRAILSKKYQLAQYTIGSAFKYANVDAYNTIISQIKGFAKLFSGQMNARNSVQSPIGIAKLYGGKWDWSRFWKLTAIISMVLAFMNFLPIPALDGGHMVFLTYEMIAGKPASDKVLEKAQMVGMVILLGLMVFAFGNDILKLLGI